MHVYINGFGSYKQSAVRRPAIDGSDDDRGDGLSMIPGMVYLGS